MLLLLVACHAAAGRGPGAVRKQVESSRLLTGTIDLSADGNVVGHALEQADDLPHEVRNLIADTVSGWRFEPEALPAGVSRARARMTLRLVARKDDDNSVTVTIRGAHFDSGVPEDGPRADGPLSAAHYPKGAQAAGIGGTVYVLAKVGADGRVADAIVEQVNLRVISDENGMHKWRNVLGRAALLAAPRWKFRMPVTGRLAKSDAVLVRVPIDFIPADRRAYGAHEWQAYVPGPRADVPWTREQAREAADAVAGGDAQLVGAGPKLLTPLVPDQG